jgi:hypothetical protein
MKKRIEENVNVTNVTPEFGIDNRIEEDVYVNVA